MHANKGSEAYIWINLCSPLPGDLPETWISERPPPLASWDKGMIMTCSSAGLIIVIILSLWLCLSLFKPTFSVV